MDDGVDALNGCRERRGVEQITVLHLDIRQRDIPPSEGRHD